jgi:hypothetical protein
MREYQQHCDPAIPVVSSVGNCAELTARLQSFLNDE